MKVNIVIKKHVGSIIRNLPQQKVCTPFQVTKCNIEQRNLRPILWLVSWTQIRSSVCLCESTDSTPRKYISNLNLPSVTVSVLLI